MVSVRFVRRWDRLPILLLRFGHRAELQRSIGSSEVIAVNRPGNTPIDNQIGILFTEISQNLLVQLLWIMMCGIPPEERWMIVFDQLLDLWQNLLLHHRLAPFWSVWLGIAGISRDRPILSMGIVEAQLHPVLVACLL